MVIGRPIEEVQERFGIVFSTVIAIRKKLACRDKDKKRCPRCGQAYENKMFHLIEHHMPLLICARYTLKLKQTEVAKMFFNGGINRHDISMAFQEINKRQDLDYGIDMDEVPSLGIPICSDGNGGFRIMKRGEVGLGLIYVDEALAWP